MSDIITELILVQGVLGGLFVYLSFYVLKDNARREEKYKNIVQNLTEVLPEVQKNVSYSKNNKSKSIIYKFYTQVIK